MSYTPELSVHYLTYLKTAVQTGLADVFAHHPDPLLRTRQETYNDKPVTRGTKVTLEWPKTKDRYPCIVVKFFERSIRRMGVGHFEEIYIGADDLAPTKMWHNIYDGDLEFGIYGLSNYDRDVLSDTLVQTITMGSLEGFTNRYLSAIDGPTYDYAALATHDATAVPDAHWNFISINYDAVSGFGETQAPVPWVAEDEQLYIKQYRVAMFGEFYSVPPVNRSGGLVEKVPVFPYIEDLEPIAEGDPDDPADWF